jgi:hypothetical protein
LRKAAVARGEESESDTARAVILAVPLLLVVIAALALPPVVSTVLPGVDPQIERLLAVMIGLLAANAAILVDNCVHGLGLPSPRTLWRDLAKGKTPAILVTLGGILVFKSMLDHSGLLPAASGELLRARIPPEFAVALLPLFAGVVTGVAVGFTGVSFPLVVGLMAHSEGAMTPMATLVLAYGFGYMGMMVSPVHLCLLVTRDFFSGNMRGIYRQILPCVSVVACYSLLLHFALKALAL